MDNFEETLSEELDNGEWKSSPTANEDIEMLKKAAKATPKKSERINLRITEHVLKSLQDRAEREGMPYQTLINSILHKFVEDQLIDKKNIQLAIDVIQQKDSNVI